MGEDYFQEGFKEWVQFLKVCIDQANQWKVKGN